MAAKATFKTLATVFPGDTFKYVQGSRFGDGIVNNNGVPTISRAGVLKFQEQTKYYYVLNNSKKYHPSVGDVCVGKCVKKMKETYLIDIGCYMYGELDSLAFENATKKNKPNLHDGDYVYCRVSKIEERPILVCLSQRKMEDGFGVLQGGWTFEVPQQMCRRIMSDRCNVLTSIGQYFPFEIAVGVNGMVWVRSEDELKDVIIENCIISCNGVSEESVPGTVKLTCEAWNI